MVQFEKINIFSEKLSKSPTARRKEDGTIVSLMMMGGCCERMSVMTMTAIRAATRVVTAEIVGKTISKLCCGLSC